MPPSGLLAENKDLAAKVKAPQAAARWNSSASISATAFFLTAGASSRRISIRQKKYPLFFQVYGEPAGTTVERPVGRKRLSMASACWPRKGYIVASIDNRGTPAPRGRAWRKMHLSPDRHPGFSRPGRGGQGHHPEMALRGRGPGRHLGLERRRLDDAQHDVPLSRNL